MSKKIAVTKEELCKGCMLCTTVCPAKALQPVKRVNSKGYQLVEVIKENCTGCASCYRICPDYVFSIKEGVE